MREIEGAVEAPLDFELGGARTRPVRYTASIPSQAPAQGLLFIIPGFGADNDDAYTAKLRERLAEAHGLATVTVDYHCRRARPHHGADLQLDMRTRLMLLGFCAAAGDKDADIDNLPDLCSRASRIKPGFQVEGQVVPPHGEQQNFGVLQAMDHLAVLGDLRARGAAFDERRILALGSSHGGYIAHLIAKMAPGTLAAVIDNSSYVQPPIGFLGLGVGFEFIAEVDAVHVLSRVKSPWTLVDRAHPAFFDRNRDLIRDLGHPPHIAAMTAQGGGPAYFMCNSAVDKTSPPAAKRRQQRALAAAGLTAELDIVTADRLDGTLYKAMDHGLDASLRGLFDRYAPQLAPREDARAPDRHAPVRYDCIDVAYEFVHGDAPPYVAGRVIPLFADLEEPADGARRTAA